MENKESKRFCPNLPYYGGFQALAGERAVRCLVESYEEFEIVEEYDSATVEPFYAPIQKEVKDPVILLWTHRLSNRQGYLNHCPKHTCLITENRNWVNETQTKAVLFYGTMLKIMDLPLPRKEGQLWALIHEESPKNAPVFSYSKLMQLFNITSTFKQESNFPLTTQYLRSMSQLTSTTYMKSIAEKNRLRKEGLAPVIYVQSDCDVPSDRDRIVRWLMKYIPIDSYGKCVHNKELPEHLRDPVKGMDHADFIELVSKYKFAIAMENGVCNDYITEKLWRPLAVGTVPITYGTPNLQEWMPNNKSVIKLEEFQSIKEIIAHIKYLDSNDTAYEEYRKFKQVGGVTNQKLQTVLTNRPWEPDFDCLGVNHRGRKGNYVNHFDCYICDKIHEQMKGEVKADDPVKLLVDKAHYGCPLPEEFTDPGNLSEKRPHSDFWYSAWMSAYCDVKSMYDLSEGGTKWMSQTDMKAESSRCLRNPYLTQEIKRN